MACGAVVAPEDTQGRMGNATRKREPQTEVVEGLQTAAVVAAAASLE